MQDKPKIIVDEDWKSQVQAEKEALQRQSPAAAADPRATVSEPPTQSTEPGPVPTRPESPKLPEPTMTLLFTSLATQAMFALGLIPDPQSDKSVVSLDEARHIIDTLQLLEVKTQGNLEPVESALLKRLLYELRMDYVAVRDRPPAGAPPT